MAKKKAAAPAAAAGPSLDVDLAPWIDLTPIEQRRATFRGLPPLPRSEPPPFDREACVARLGKLRKAGYLGLRWQDLGLTPSLSSGEALFWLEAMLVSWGSGETTQEIAARLEKASFDGPPDFETLAKRLAKVEYGVPPEGVAPMLALMKGDALAAMLLSMKSASSRCSLSPGGQLVEGFVRFGPAWLSVEESEAARGVVQAAWAASVAKKVSSDFLPAAVRLAAALGMHSELEAFVSDWNAPPAFNSEWGYAGLPLHDAVCGLGSEELVARHWRRLRLRFQSSEQATAFLACTGCSALDLLRDCILEHTTKSDAESMLKVLAKVHAPEAVEPMLACMLESKAQGPARAWFDENPVFAVRGLIPVAGGSGKLQTAALERLRVEVRLGRGELVAAALGREPDQAVAGKVRREVLESAAAVSSAADAAKEIPPWFRDALAETPKSKRKKPLPSWSSPPLLPPLPVEGGRLPDEAVGAVLSQLASMPLETRQPLLAAVKEHVAEPARDAFAWKLYESWVADGAPNDEKWGFAALGRIGGSAAEAKLKKLIPEWRLEELHARAAYGLECLRGIGSATALKYLVGVAEDKKQKALSKAAAEVVSKMAQDRGLTKEDLEDRLVPSCGLDAQGRRTFSFGPRTFSVALDGGLKPQVRDEEGKLRGDLPAPTSKDDAKLAAAAVADWKELKKEVKKAASQLGARLEQAMVSGRRWKFADFETYMVRHPLATHLARRLLWEALDASGKRLATFRVTDEQDYADVSDSPVPLAENYTDFMGIVHPLTLSAEERSAWGEVFGDYELAAPFPQLGRALHAIEPGEGDATELARFKGLKLPAPALVYTLERLGWNRGKALQGGQFDEHSKPFPSAGVTAVVGYDGDVCMADVHPSSILTVNGCVFVSGLRKPSGYGWEKEKLVPLRDVPPVPLSEVLADLFVLKSKAT